MSGIAREIIEEISSKNQGEPEFIQAVTEVVESC